VEILCRTRLPCGESRKRWKHQGLDKQAKAG
jgi:hypothetical protein